MKAMKSKDVVVRGVIYPSTRDKNHNVTSIVIDTEDQDTYFVDNNKNGKILMEFIHHRVEITGSVRENEDDEYIINVREYKILENAEDRKKANE
jgi:hypothetical protein